MEKALLKGLSTAKQEGTRTTTLAEEGTATSRESARTATMPEERTIALEVEATLPKRDRVNSSRTDVLMSTSHEQPASQACACNASLPGGIVKAVEIAKLCAEYLKGLDKTMYFANVDVSDFCSYVEVEMLRVLQRYEEGARLKRPIPPTHPMALRVLSKARRVAFGKVKSPFVAGSRNDHGNGCFDLEGSEDFFDNSKSVASMLRVSSGTVALLADHETRLRKFRALTERRASLEVKHAIDFLQDVDPGTYGELCSFVRGDL